MTKSYNNLSTIHEKKEIVADSVQGPSDCDSYLSQWCDLYTSLLPHNLKHNPPFDITLHTRILCPCTEILSNADIIWNIRIMH